MIGLQPLSSDTPLPLPSCATFCRIYDKRLHCALATFRYHPTVQPKTEELLNILLWIGHDSLLPTFRNLTQSYEGWAYRNGLLREARTLEKRQLIERSPAAPHNRLYRLTHRGRLLALGGRDPQARWSREWDGFWRLVLFDVPTMQNNQRDKLRRYLRERGFGYLQNSVWITPDPLEEEREALAGGKVDVESLLLLQARPCAGESNAEIVAGAWDFEEINRCYARHLSVLEDLPDDMGQDEVAAKTLRRWLSAEREAWLDAVTGDPLLPERLLPSGYLGQRAWRRRIEVLRLAGRCMRAFRFDLR